MKLPSIVYIIFIVLFIAILVVLKDYNKLVRLHNRVKKEKSRIDICLNKRFDLIPNVVETVKGYAGHEKSTLADITELRNKFKDTGDVYEENKLNNDLNKYLAIVEAYPDLKANTEFLALQKQLSDIEQDLCTAREIYNNAVTSYNNAIQTVPSNIVANIFNFKEAKLFEIEEEKKENIKVEL